MIIAKEWIRVLASIKEETLPCMYLKKKKPEENPDDKRERHQNF